MDYTARPWALAIVLSKSMGSSSLLAISAWAVWGGRVVCFLRFGFVVFLGFDVVSKAFKVLVWVYKGFMLFSPKVLFISSLRLC